MCCQGMVLQLRAWDDKIVQVFKQQTTDVGLFDLAVVQVSTKNQV